MKLTTRDVGMQLGGKQIIQGVEIQVGTREFVGLIGPNGSGKSTLLKCVYRVLQPSEGAVLLDGQALSGMRVRESARKLAVVSQHNYYNFDFAVREVVLMRSEERRGGKEC